MEVVSPCAGPAQQRGHVKEVKQNVLRAREVLYAPGHTTARMTVVDHF
mgnify:FL=1